jgi:hypothetical protein
MRGPYICLETKQKMKERTRKSPDLADDAVVLAQVCHARLGLSPNESSHYDEIRDTPWKRFLRKRSLDAEYATALPY